MPKLLLLLFTGLFVFAAGANAQTWEIGAGAGAAGYIGDFNPNNPLKFSGAEYTGFIKRNFNGYFSIKLNYTHGSVAGADSLSANQQLRNRNLSFFSNLDEFSLVGELNFFNYVPQLGTNKFTPFVFLGVGTVNYDPEANYKGQEYELRPLTTEGETPYKNSAFAIPYGAGIKYNIAGQLTLTVDLGYRTTNTPYLDDVSGNYPNKSLLPGAISQALSDRSGELTGVNTGSPGSQRGNYHNDTYMFLGFTISYTFLSSKCYSLQ